MHICNKIMRKFIFKHDFVASVNTLEEVDETRIEVVVPQHKESNILKALFTNHPYEEVAYSLIALTNKNQYHYYS